MRATLSPVGPEKEMERRRAVVLQEGAESPVTARDLHQDEGNAWGRLGEVLGRLGREDEARAAYDRGIQQAEKYGHSGMADDLRAALVGLGE